MLLGVPDPPVGHTGAGIVRMCPWGHPHSLRYTEHSLGNALCCGVGLVAECRDGGVQGAQCHS